MKYLLPILFILSTSFVLAQKKETPPPPKAITPDHPSKSLITIAPKARAQDFSQAYTLLSKEKTPSKIFFTLSKGEQITNILSLSILDNGTLIMFKLATAEGILHKVVCIEDILEIGHM